jgi:hypothetical protein
LRANWESIAKSCGGIGSARPAISIAGSEEGADRKPAISITGKQAGERESNQPFRVAGFGAGRPSRCERLAEVIAAKLEAALRPRRIYQDRVEQNNFGDSYQSVQPFIRKFKADAAAASLAHEN